MSETRDPEDKVAKGRRTMSLGVRKTVEQGLVRQNFSHGRSKSVVVEKKRSKRSMSLQDAVAAVPAETKPSTPNKAAREALSKRQQEAASDKQQQRNVLRQLSTDEIDARARALT
ncbi:MAG: translation initiation factor IF-2 associated domain-containing protein, partial [Rhodomicrobiaceae bacterium]